MRVQFYYGMIVAAIAGTSYKSTTFALKVEHSSSHNKSQSDFMQLAESGPADYGYQYLYGGEEPAGLILTETWIEEPVGAEPIGQFDEMTYALGLAQSEIESGLIGMAEPEMQRNNNRN